MHACKQYPPTCMYTSIRSCCDHGLAQEIDHKDARIPALESAPCTGFSMPVALGKIEGSGAKVAVKWVQKAMLQTHGTES